MLDILLNKMVDKELKLRMSKTGLAPEAGVARVTKMTKEQLLKLPDAALLKFANDHPLEYNRLLKS